MQRPLGDGRYYSRGTWWWTRRDERRPAPRWNTQRHIGGFLLLLARRCRERSRWPSSPPMNPNKTSQGKCRGPNRKIGGRNSKEKNFLLSLRFIRDEFLTGTMMTIRTCFSDLSFDLFFFLFLSVSFDLFLLWKCPPTAAAAAGLCPFSIDCYSPKRVRCVCIIFCEAFSLQFLFTFFASKFTIRFYRLWKLISWAKDLSARGYSLDFLFLSLFDSDGQRI